MPDAVIDERRLELDGIGADRFVRYDQLRHLGIPYSRQHLTVLEERGDFPARVRLSERVVAWRLSDLKAWMAARE
jgi:predicted DNA-binding transcriptional regulator AlpA